MSIEKIKKQIQDSINVKEDLFSDTAITENIYELTNLCIKSLERGGKIIFFGNGGSFSDAQHLSAELTGRYAFDRGALASVVLGANNSSISAIGNDFGFEKVFSREIEAIAETKDFLIGITTSGNSKNVIEAIKCANSLKINSYILTGQSGGDVNNLTKCINVPSEITARIQECHIMIGQIVCGLIEEHFFPIEAEKYYSDL